MALALALTLSGTNTETTELAAMIYVIARVAYIPAAASGIPLARSVAWFASMAGLVLMIPPLL